MRLKSEQELLNSAVRIKIIEEIKGTENNRRKHEAFKRYECYRDKTYIHVIEKLLRQFDQTTVEEMSYAISDIGLVKKTIDKLARVYAAGVERRIIDGTPEQQEDLHKLARELDMNTFMKKTNRYLKLFKNTLFYIKPLPVEDTELMTVRGYPLAPYLYDVVEYYEDRTQPMVVVLSNYRPNTEVLYAVNPAEAQRTANYPRLLPRGDGVDQIIADAPVDSGQNKEEYIFWSKSFHFTCNSKGEIVSGKFDEKGELDFDSILNPILTLPFVNFAEDQDENFWAQGGDDLVDGSILVNSLISHLNHIAVTQGYGQIVMKGKSVPTNLKVGPNKIVRLEYESGDPVPEFEFASANPPINQIMDLITMYTAMLLTTNNLSTSGIATKLDGGVAFPSGVAMMIDKAESMEDVSDQQQLFLDKEPVIWSIISKWMNLYASRGLLTESLALYVLPEDIDVSIKFPKPSPLMSEQEKVDLLKARKELGLDTEVELIMKDNPELSEQEAVEKLLKLQAEKLTSAQKTLAQQGLQQTNNEPVGQQLQDQTEEQVDESNQIDGQPESVEQ